MAFEKYKLKLETYDATGCHVWIMMFARSGRNSQRFFMNDPNYNDFKRGWTDCFMCETREFQGTSDITSVDIDFEIANESDPGTPTWVAKLFIYRWESNQWIYQGETGRFTLDSNTFEGPFPPEGYRPYAFEHYRTPAADEDEATAERRIIAVRFPALKERVPDDIAEQSDSQK